MSALSPPPPLVDRFRADVAALGPAPGRLAVAVSGGPDSVALLLLAAAAYPEQVHAATVDHGLRPESAAEARFVADLCRALEVPHATLAVDVDTARASIQQSAREARYLALDGWMKAGRIAVLATAHHIDDQAETLMMRLLRGAGVGGLAGVRARTLVPAPGSRRLLIRPLLGWRRHELRAIVDAAGIVAVDDPSNRDAGYDRARIRQRLAETPWIEPAPLARAAGALGEADEALDWAAAQLWDERVTQARNGIRWSPRGIPAELRRRIVIAILARLAPDAPPPRGQEVGRLLGVLENGGTATLAGIQAKGGSSWLFSTAPPRKRSG